MRVILVREWDAQMGGSGCCGRLGGRDCAIGEPETYAYARTDMEAMGEVYRALRSEFADAITVEVVDPRNTVWLVPTVWRDARARGLGVGGALRQIAAGAGQGAVICDGRVVHRGGPPDPDGIVEVIARELAASRRATSPVADRGAER